MNKKRLFIPLFLVPLFSVSSLTSCSLFNPKQEAEKVIERIETNNMQYISERTFSLKFVEESSRKMMLGTGWIFAKENDAENTPSVYDDIYYIATNLHVAGAIQNRNTNLFKYDSKQQRYIQNYDQDLNYNKLYLGLVSTDGINVGTNYTSEPNSTTHYDSFFNLEDNSSYTNTTLETYPAVSVAYTPIDTFSSMQIKDQARVYWSDVLENATMDFAILRMDFSKLQNSSELINNALDAYNYKPTTFSTKYTDDTPVTIAGFPLKSEDGTNAGKWNGSYNVIAYDLPYESTNVSTGYKKSVNNLNNKWDDGIINTDWNDMTKVKPQYVIKDHIAFSYNGYASYRNIAKQALFKDVYLTGGSSGSMAINSNYQVVGIYWGAYSNLGIVNEKYIGAVDLFVNDKDVQYKYIDGNENKSITVLKPYNIFDDFMAKFPNTNLKENIDKTM